MTNRKEVMIQKLATLEPYFLEITDRSHMHAGHIGNPDGIGESHFHLEIGSNQLTNLSKIEQHRVINKLLKEEFEQGLHALTITIKKH